MLIKRMSKKICWCAFLNANYLHNFYYVPHGDQLFSYFDCDLLKNDPWFVELQKCYSIGEPEHIIADPHKFYTEMLQYLPAEELGVEPGFVEPGFVENVINAVSDPENDGIIPVDIELEDSTSTTNTNVSLSIPPLKRSDMQDMLGNM
jgi:hypothetical protein